MNKTYLIPILSISFFALFVLGGNITGFVTLEQKEVQANILLTTTAEDVLPKDALITVTFAETTKSLTAQQFIEKTGTPYQLREGTFKQISYTGQGYTGENTYTLPLNAFELPTNPKSGTYTLQTTVTYQDQTISTNEQKITIE